MAQEEQKDLLKVVNVKLPASLHRLARLKCVNENMVMGQLIESALASYMDLEKDKDGAWTEKK